MKCLVIAVPLLLLSTTVAAQQRPAAILATTTIEPKSEPPAPASSAADEPTTLVGPGGFVQHSGWYVGPSLGTTTVAGRFGFAAGVRGAWIINRQFGIGMAATGFEIDPGSSSPDRRMDGGYGGLLLQYTFASEKLVHGFVDTTIGGGAICPNTPTWGRSDCRGDYHGFFMVEPTANVELNVTTFMRVALGAGYRFAAGGSDSSLSDRDMSGFVARTNVVFGQF